MRLALLAGVLVATWLLFSIHNQDFFFHPEQLAPKHGWYRTILDDIDDNRSFGVSLFTPL